MEGHQTNIQLADALTALELAEDRLSECALMAQAATDALDIAQEDVEQKRALALSLAWDALYRSDVVNGRPGDPLPDLFDWLWEMLARQGKADAKGGAEYRRVRFAWEQAGKPARIHAFIFREANRGPNTADADPQAAAGG